MSKVRILSPRPGINKNTAVNAVFLFILVGLWIRTTKFFCRVRTFHSIYHVDVINLRVSSYLCELRGACSYILGFPRFCAECAKPAGHS